MKKPLSTQLLEAQNELDLLRAQLDTQTKAKEAADSLAKHYRESKDEATKEVEGLHDMLDLIPNTPAREREPRDGEWGKVKLSAAARLVGFIANLA